MKKMKKKHKKKKKLIYVKKGELIITKYLIFYKNIKNWKMIMNIFNLL